MKWLRLILVVSIFFIGHPVEAQSKYQELELKGPVKQIQVASYDQTTQWWRFSDSIFSKESKLLGTVSYKSDGNIVTFYDSQEQAAISITGSENKVAKGSVQHVDRRIFPPSSGESYTLSTDGTFQKIEKSNEFGRVVLIEETSATQDQLKQLQVITYDESGREIKNEHFTWIDENQSNYNFPQIKSGETMFSSTNSVGMENNNYRGAGKRNHNSPVNNSAIAMNNSVIGTPIDRSGGFSSGTVADRRETAVAQVKEPFSASNSMIPGPMRMDGVDENPPPEGMPVGEGIWILLILAGAYIFYRKKGKGCISRI